MLARIFFGLVSLIVAMLFVRLLVDETRRARVAVRSNDRARPPKDAGRLKQDPATGVYYPVD
jgi:hypothetical protein